MTTKKHIHKVKRKEYKSGNSIYYCILDECSFKIECDLFLGKTTICHICGEPFAMTEYTVKLKRPHCSNCNKIKVKNNDGSSSFVRKSNLPVMTAVANDTVTDLKNRLANSINASLMANDEDI